MKKKEFREIFLKKRAVTNLADNERIAARLREVLSGSSISLVHSFVGCRTRSEVDTKRIRQLLRIQLPSVQWAAPRMIPGTSKLQNYLWNDETLLITNRWGIEEPGTGTSQPVETQAIDAVLVPLLAFDQKGHRVGYGGGFYDRFLAQCRPDTLKIGLSAFEAIEEIEDADEWDVKLNYCVTPTNIYHWNS